MTGGVRMLYATTEAITRAVIATIQDTWLLINGKIVSLYVFSYFWSRPFDLHVVIAD